MAICGICKNVSSYNIQVKCSGLCGYIFHPDCIKGAFEKKTCSSKEYKCKEYRAASSQSQLQRTLMYLQKIFFKR